MPESDFQMTDSMLQFLKNLYARLTGFVAKKDRFTDEPLLSNSEINELIAEAGKLNKVKPQTSNLFTQFGDQASTITGSGLDFADRRDYVSGGDPRFIDWKASARSQQTLLKNYFTDVNMPGCVVIDRSSSMVYRFDHSAVMDQSRSTEKFGPAKINTAH